MRTSHFASIQVVVPPEAYGAAAQPADEGIISDQTAKLKTVGMAQSLSIDDNFGTRAENTIGTPLPVLAPGYQVTNIRIEKATIDGADFRNLGAFNPLWAHVGTTYRDASLIDLGGAAGELQLPEAGEGGSNQSMYPFMFVLAVKNRVSDSYKKSNIGLDNEAVTTLQSDAESESAKARSNSFGVYVCVLESASISMSSQQVVIMDSISAVARPLTGTWFNDAITTAYSANGDATNGMRDVVNSILYGFRA